jgi:uroporphyrinogen decarboxylase
MMLHSNTARPASLSTVTKPLLKVLHGEVVTPTPIWLMRQAGRYLPEYRELRGRADDFLRLCLTPALAAEATMQPIRRFALDATILFSDILIVLHALGQKLEYRDGEGPVLEPVRSIEALTQLDSSGFEEKIAPVGHTVRLVKASLGSNTALIGFAGAPWTVASYMVEGQATRDFSAVKRWAFTDPDGFSLLIDRLVEATVAYLDRQIRTGVEVVQLFDSWAGVLPEAEFRRWVIAPTRRITETLHETHPSVPVIGFPRGAGLMYRAYFTETGVDALSIDAMVPLAVARKNLQPVGPVQGNLDPLLLVAGGDAMTAAATTILEQLAGQPFVFNLGHGIVPDTPPDHVRQLADLVHRFGVAEPA